jgi:hypothetical protein
LTKPPPKVRRAIVQLRLTDDEKVRFESFCESRGLTVSEALRRLARAAGDSGPIYDGQDRDAVLALKEQIRAIGVNLNQAVKLMHQGQMAERVAFEPLLTGLLRRLDEAEEFYGSLCSRSWQWAAGAAEAAGE